jgi:hypothetical protein
MNAAEVVKVFSSNYINRNWQDVLCKILVDRV